MICQSFCKYETDRRAQQSAVEQRYSIDFGSAAFWAFALEAMDKGERETTRRLLMAGHGGASPFLRPLHTRPNIRTTYILHIIYKIRAKEAEEAALYINLTDRFVWPASQENAHSSTIYCPLARIYLYNPKTGASTREFGTTHL